MGTRTISTVIKLENEAQYRTALKNSEGALKALKAELDLVSSEYRTNANSMEALTQKGTVLSKTQDVLKERISTLKGELEKYSATHNKEKEALEAAEKEYKKAKAVLDSYGKTVDKSDEGYQKARADVEKWSKEVTKHQAKLDSSTTSVNKYTLQLNQAETELVDLNDQVHKNKLLLSEAIQSADGCATSIDRYGDSVREAADGTGKSVSAVEALSSAMIAGGVKQKVEDLAGAMMECSEAASAYELSLAKVSTIADSSVLSQEDMRSGILGLSSDLGKGADEIAEAAYQALSAGVDTANMLDFTRQATELSVAGFTDSATAVDVLTTILNAYGLEASQTEAVASKLVKTQDLGKITVADMGKVMGRVIPTAAAYGVDLDNIAAAYANMTSSGINAENTTTYLSTMLDELSDSGSKVAGILKEQTGKSFSELMSSGASLGDVLDTIGESVNNDKTEFSNLWSSATAGKAAVALFNTGAQKFNSTLKQMAGSSGSVAKNYEKLANTSDYASRRMDVASQNLKIAVGSQLNPVLDKLRTAGAGILEAAARVVSQNPVLVSTITGVVTALGLMAAGLSALMIVKSVTAAMSALNITLAANPIGLVAIAITGLVAAISTFTAQAKEANAQVEAMTEASRNLSDTVEESSKTYEDSVASAEAAASVVDRYIDRLEALEQQGLDTDAQQMEYQMTLDKINEIMPGLNAEIDANTKAVKGGTDALRDQADAWKQAAVQEALYSKYKDDVAAMADAEYELAKNQALLSSAEKDETDILMRLTAVNNSRTALTERLNEMNYDNIEATEEETERYMSLTSQIEALNSEWNDLSLQLSENSDTQENLHFAIEQGSAAIEANQDVVDAATAAYEELTGAQVENTEVSGENAEETAAAAAAAEEYAGRLTDIRESLSGYEEAFSAAGLNIDEFSQYLADNGLTADEAATKIEEYRDRILNATDTISQKSTADMDTLISNMQQRTDTYRSWNDNLALLQSQYGDQLSEDFIAYVRDLGPEYDAVLSEWLNGGSEQMFELQRTMQDGSATAVEAFAGEYDALPDTVRNESKALEGAADEAGEGVSTAMTEAAAETVESFKQEFSELPGEMQTIGEQVIDGMIRGLNGRSSALYRTVRSIVNTSIAEAKAAADTHSPSKKTEKIYGDVGEGMVVGLEKKRQRINETSQSVVAGSMEQMRAASQRYQSMAETKIPVIRPTRDWEVEQPARLSITQARISRARMAQSGMVTANVSKLDTRGSDAVLLMLRNILAAVKSGNKIVLDSGTLVGSTCDQYDLALGQKRVLTDRGAI